MSLALGVNVCEKMFKNKQTQIAFSQLRRIIALFSFCIETGKFMQLHFLTSSKEMLMLMLLDMKVYYTIIILFWTTSRLNCLTLIVTFQSFCHVINLGTFRRIQAFAMQHLSKTIISPDAKAHMYYCLSNPVVRSRSEIGINLKEKCPGVWIHTLVATDMVKVIHCKNDFRLLSHIWIRFRPQILQEFVKFHITVWTNIYVCFKKKLF